MTATRRTLQSVLIAALLAACASPAASGPTAPSPSGSGLAAAPTTSAPSASTATASGRVDLSGLDVCTLLAEQTVQELTGSSVGFATSRRQGACFWGARQAVPPYVEVTVRASQAGLASYTFPSGCTVVPVTGVGSEAKGATCPGTQLKVRLTAFDRGVILEVLVNAPERPLQPADIGTVANRVLLQITSG